MSPIALTPLKIEMSEKFENINGKKKRKKRQTMIYITLQRKLKI
jgi:hypothetical protein